MENINENKIEFKEVMAKTFNVYKKYILPIAIVALLCAIPGIMFAVAKDNISEVDKKNKVIIMVNGQECYCSSKSLKELI